MSIWVVARWCSWFLAALVPAPAEAALQTVRDVNVQVRHSQHVVILWFRQAVRLEPKHRSNVHTHTQIHRLVASGGEKEIPLRAAEVATDDKVSPNRQRARLQPTVNPMMMMR